MNGALTTVSTQRPPPRPAAPETGQYLTFTLGGESFAVGILAIREIIEYHALTAVPMMPDFVRGVINLRGAVVPVIDPLARLGRASSPVTKRTCIVIVDVRDDDDQQHIVGLIVDLVQEVLEIASADVEPAPSFGASIRSEYIAGMGKVRGKFVIVLALDRLLAIAADELLAAHRSQAEAVAN